MQILGNYAHIKDEEDLKSWVLQQAGNNLMPIPDFAYLYLHKNVDDKDIYGIQTAHRFMSEQEQGLYHKTPSVRDLLMKNTAVMVKGLFASPYYTAVMTDHYLNDTDTAPFQKTIRHKPIMYCPLCAKEDEEEFMSVPHLRGDKPVYRIRVPHQVEGVTACHKHDVILTTDPHAEAVSADKKEIRTAKMVYALYKSGCTGSIDDLMGPLKERMREKGIKNNFSRAFGSSASVMSAAAQVFEPTELMEIYKKDEDQMLENAIGIIRIKYPSAEIVSCDYPLMTYRCGCGQEHTVYVGSAVLGVPCPADAASEDWTKTLIYRSQFCIDPRFELTQINDSVTGMIRHRECGSTFPMKLRRVMAGDGFTCPVCARKRLEELVGQERTMNCGLNAKITAVRTVVDIDIEFEDGRIRNGVVYRRFLDGEILPLRFYQDKRIGGKRIMNCGLEAVITASYKKDGKDLIDVRFEDGSEKAGITYEAWKTKRLEPDRYRQRKAVEGIIGQWRMMNCGLKARMIRYINSGNCDVEFEDGSVRRGVRRDHFMFGELSPEGYYEKIHLGEKRTMRNGLEGTIVSCPDSSHVTVRLSNGDLVVVTYNAFHDGYVKSETLEKHRKDSHVGERYKQNCGIWATIIEYVNSNMTKVRFDNGEVREKVSYNKLKGGSVLPPSMQQRSRVGDRYPQSCGQTAEIIADRGSEDLDVRFDNGRLREHVKLTSLKKGTVQPLSRAQKFREEHLGEDRIMKCGLRAKIIAINSATDITVQFETGEMREHIVYANFKACSVSPVRRKW